MTTCVGCGRDVGTYQRFHIRLSDATLESREVTGGPLCPECFDAVSYVLADPAAVEPPTEVNP